MIKDQYKYGNKWRNFIAYKKIPQVLIVRIISLLSMYSKNVIR
jgi:hypothetical protein